jgi:hypothetical protein
MSVYLCADNTKELLSSLVPNEEGYLGDELVVMPYSFFKSLSDKHQGREFAMGKIEDAKLIMEKIQ